MRRVVNIHGHFPSLASPKTEIPDEDNYQDRIIKYIPSDVIAVYVTLNSIAKSAGDDLPQSLVQWVIFLIVFALTPFYVKRLTHYPGAKSATKQIVISTLAFFVWVFALGGPFQFTAWYQSVYGALVLPLYTFIIPIIKGDPLPPQA